MTDAVRGVERAKRSGVRRSWLVSVSKRMQMRSYIWFRATKGVAPRGLRRVLLHTGDRPGASSFFRKRRPLYFFGCFLGVCPDDGRSFGG